MIKITHIIFFFTLSFIVGAVGSLGAPSTALSARFVYPPLKFRHSLYSGCHFQRANDFFTCNCYFLETEGHSALLPDQRLDPKVLKGAVSSCKREFGPTSSLAAGCVRISRCKSYVHVKCFKISKGKKFNRAAAIKGMKLFRNSCAHGDLDLFFKEK